MKYIIVVHFPIGGHNFARGFRDAATAITYLNRVRKDAEEDQALFGEQTGKPLRTISIHRAQHLETMPETLFWDISAEQLQALAADEAKGA